MYSIMKSVRDAIQRSQSTKGAMRRIPWGPHHAHSGTTQPRVQLHLLPSSSVTATGDAAEMTTSTRDARKLTEVGIAMHGAFHKTNAQRLVNVRYSQKSNGHYLLFDMTMALTPATLRRSRMRPSARSATSDSG